MELFSDAFLADELRFRGGTALNKLHFQEPLRYSEDMDLVRTTEGPIKPVLRKIREILEPWLGEAAFDQSPVSPKLIFRADAEDGGAPLRLKVEIAIWETEAYAGPAHVDYAVDNPWFAGRAAIPTYSREEMPATKLRARLQRSKGRDLLDLSHGLDVFDGTDAAQVVELFLRYLRVDKLSLSRAQAEERMFAKLVNPGFLADIRPLLTPAAADSLTDEVISAAFSAVFSSFIIRLPGKPWARTEEMIERFGLTPRGIV